MTNAKVHEGFRVDKKVEEHWPNSSMERPLCSCTAIICVFSLLNHVRVI